MSRLLLSLAILAALSPAARARDFPPPESFLERESISISVLHARPQDEGFRKLLSNAWTALQNRGAGGSPFLSFLLSVMGKGQEAEGLLSFLPLQAVRVDRLDGEGRPEPTFAFTVQGWPGFQSLFYGMLSAGTDGKPFPTREHMGQTYVLRSGWEDPTKSRILARVKGTFLACPTPDRADALISGMLRPKGTPPQTQLLYAYQRLDATQDTYGALLNKEGSLLKFLDWLNEVDMARVRQDVGAEELEEAASHVKWMTWEGDLVSDDQVNLRVLFETDSAEGAQRVADVMMSARTVLAKYNRAGHFQVGATGPQVKVFFSMIGFRDAVEWYVRQSS